VIIESLVHLEGYFAFDPKMAHGLCYAICRHNEDIRALFTYLRIGYRRFDTIPPPQFPTLSLDHNYRIILHVFSTKDEEIIGDFLCAWCTGPVCAKSGNLASHLVDLVLLERFGPRLQLLTFWVLGRMKYLDFKQIELPKLITLLDRIEDGVLDRINIEAKFRAPGPRDFLLDALSSSEGRKVFPLRYWRAAAELAARDRRPSSPDLPRIYIIRFLKAEGEWEKLAWWMGAIWASALPADVVEDRMEEIVGSTELVILHHPDAAAVIEDLVKISSERALGVKHAKKLRSILEKRQDGTVDNGREGSSGIR
jgi:hypothetical protein